MRKYLIIIFNLFIIYIMAQQEIKLVNLNEFTPYEYEFYKQNLSTHKTCGKHKEKDLYYIVPDNGQYAIILDNEARAKEILNSTENVNLGGVLETNLQEEMELITPDNINEKTKEILVRFNKNFKLNVNYNPSTKDTEFINKQVIKTAWNKENIFLLNFYMMEVTKRKYNYKDWCFQKINTFNPFYVIWYLNGKGLESNYYKLLDSKTKKYFDFEKYLELGQ